MLEGCAKDKLPIPAHCLPTLAGNLIWASMVDELLPPFTRALAACTQGLHPKWWKHVSSTYRWPEESLSKAITAELGWLTNHLQSRGLRAQRLLQQSHRKALYVTSDASGASNCVAVVTEAVAWRFHLVDCGGIKMPTLEAIALPLLYAHAGSALRGASVMHASDALGACFWAAAGKARDSTGNDLQKCMRSARAAGLIEAASSWLSRSDNYIADRGAAMPWRQACQEGLAELNPPKRLVEVTVSGLPSSFLAEWARSFSADFSFADAAWQEVHPRGT